MMCFWKKINIITIGTTINAAPAICRPKAVPYWPFKSDKPTDKVYSFSSLAIISGHRKLFHAPIKVNIP
ncbi:hypothetical protein D3C80_2173460 [compost metagenome]